ncbi:uncharacterized protein B4U79_11942, partial [Dinothrombium tinctorium]
MSNNHQRTPSITLNGNLLTPPLSKQQQRKLSLPVIYPRVSPSQYLEAVTNSQVNSQSYPHIFDAGKKRLSAVGIAVSNHLQSTIGWKKSPSHELIVEDAKCLCAICFRLKLRKCGIVHKKLGLQRLRSMGAIGTRNSQIAEIAVEFGNIIRELERSYPKLYSSVLSNTGNSTKMFSSLSTVQHVLQIIAQELFRNEITWERIAAYYAIAGALAVDCIKTGHSDYLLGLIDALSGFIERDLVVWIAQQGGW